MCYKEWGAKEERTYTGAETAITVHYFLLLQQRRLHCISNGTTMTVAIVDFLICWEVSGIWMRGERRCLVKRFDIGGINWGIIMLVRLEIFIEGFEHSKLGVLVRCFWDLETGEEYIEAYICSRPRLAHSSHDRRATFWTELENSRSEYILFGGRMSLLWKNSRSVPRFCSRIGTSSKNLRPDELWDLRHRAAIFQCIHSVNT